MLKSNDDQPTEGKAGNASSSSDDGMALILQQAGKSAAEVAALATLDDADSTAENQFSGQAPTIASLFGTGKAREFFAGNFTPDANVASVMGASLEFLMKRKRKAPLSTIRKCCSAVTSFLDWPNEVSLDSRFRNSTAAAVQNWETSVHYCER